MQKTPCLIALCAALLAGASKAHAQMLTWADRGYVGLNVGLQQQAGTFIETSTPVINGENASVTVPHTLGRTALIDGSGPMGLPSMSAPQIVDRSPRRDAVCEWDTCGSITRSSSFFPSLSNSRHGHPQR
jgi:hypothetical protein